MAWYCTYMDPNDAEKDSKEVAEFLVFVRKKAAKYSWMHSLSNLKSIEVRRIAKETYGDPSRLDDLTSDLCSLLRALPARLRDEIVYDPNNKGIIYLTPARELCTIEAWRIR
jgi:uncharacterized protein with von Willebrand factor type A (vWA) domain